MHNAHRWLSASVLAAAVTVGAAACGSSGSAPDPLASMTSQKIAAKAVIGTEAAPTVTVNGSGTDDGHPLSIDLTLVRGKGCSGTIGEGSLGTLKIIYTYSDSTMWLLPDSKFYKTSGAPASVATQLQGKYLQVKSGTGSNLSSLSLLCSINDLLSQFTVNAGTGKGTKTSVNGQTAVEITDKTGAGSAYVTDTAAPELLRIAKPGSEAGQINLSYPSTAPALTSPPASEVIDGSKYGF